MRGQICKNVKIIVTRVKVARNAKRNPRSRNPSLFARDIADPRARNTGVEVETFGNLQLLRESRGSPGIGGSEVPKSSRRQEMVSDLDTDSVRTLWCLVLLSY